MSDRARSVAYSGTTSVLTLVTDCYGLVRFGPSPRPALAPRAVGPAAGILDRCVTSLPQQAPTDNRPNQRSPSKNWAVLVCLSQAAVPCTPPAR